MAHPAPTTPRQWHYASGGAPIGPVSEQAIIQMLSAAQIGAETMVWNESMPDWAPVKSVAALAGHIRAAPPTVAGRIPAPVPTDHGIGVRMLVPVGRTPWAIAAGYLGLFSVLGVFAPLAVICGIAAIVHIRRNPRMHGMGRAIFGIVMGAACTVVYAVAIIGNALSK